MKNTFFLIISTLMLMSGMISCDNDPYYYPTCTTTNGGNDIGGWEKGDSTDIHHKKDSVSGFEVSLENWTDTITKDINI